MRTTRQSSTTRAESDDMTLQQVMEMIQGLQEAMAVSKVEQECIQVDLAASQARNEELCRANEELRRGLHNHPGNRETEDRECFTPPREFPMPFSQSIMEAVIPHTFVGPKVTFTGMEDPEAHLTAFHTQMMLVDGFDVVRCKLLMSTLTGMAMDWFISLPDGHVTSFAQLSQLFSEQYIANRAPPSVSYDLFDVKQYQGGDVERVHQPFRGTGGEGWHHRRADDRVCIQERDLPWAILRVDHQESPQNFRKDKASRGGAHRDGRGSVREARECCTRPP